jgi:hypothetical protein
MTVTQKKAGELLTGMPQAAYGGLPSPDKVTHCFVGTVRHPYCRQFVRPV